MSGHVGGDRFFLVNFWVLHTLHGMKKISYSPGLNMADRVVIQYNFLAFLSTGIFVSFFPKLLLYDYPSLTLLIWLRVEERKPLQFLTYQIAGAFKTFLRLHTYMTSSNSLN